MRCLTLYQPWADAISQGLKGNETRSWATSYRGPLAIHAARKWDSGLRYIAQISGVEAPMQHPRLGVVVAICNLVACYSTNDRARVAQLSSLELSWGDYSADRFFWVLGAIRPLPEPIPARGGQGLWEWEPPVDLAALGAAPVVVQAQRELRF